jgi:hypothetical protein
MKYAFSKCVHPADEEIPEGGRATTIIPDWAVERWQRQIATDYADLTEEEKDSDRREADKFLALLEEFETTPEDLVHGGYHLEINVRNPEGGIERTLRCRGLTSFQVNEAIRAGQITVFNVLAEFLDFEDSEGGYSKRVISEGFRDLDARRVIYSRLDPDEAREEGPHE